MISDASDRAIALARRGQATQLAQLDLPTRRHRSWGLVSITGGAKTYDGSVWFAHDGRRVMGLDALAATPRCFWTVNVDDERVIDVMRSPHELIVLAGGWGMEWWRYELPGPVLRERKPIKLPVDPSRPDDGGKVIVPGSWPAWGGTVYALVFAMESKELRVVSGGPSRPAISVSLDVPFDQLAVTGAATPELFALALASGPDCHVVLFDNALTLRVRLRFPGTTPPRLRFCGADLVIAADGGRLTIFDTERGALRTVAVL